MRRKNKVLLLMLGSVLWISGCNGEEGMVYLPSTGTAATYEGNLTEAGVQEYETQLLVYVCGAVMEPGVVSLSGDARVVDAIALAGGMTEEAAESYVNLAAKLTDGEKIYVPTKAEVVSWESLEALAIKVNINTADKEALCTLAGIGESKAEAIIAYREKNGPFQQEKELMQVPGIKESLYEQIEDKIRVK